MKKKAVVLLALAAALSIGTATFSAMAAEGWALSGNSWVYYGDNGYKVTSEWRKGATDNLWRYLDGSGNMAISTWVDDTYYVDTNGILVTDRWLKLKKGYSSGWGDTTEDKWYYFGSSGKVIEDTWKKIDNKWYLLDEDGAMVTGWSEDYTYYLSDEGVMRTGWIRLEPPEEYSGFDESYGPDIDSDDGKYWYYFQSNGKKYEPSINDGENKQYKIDGIYYCFNSEGQMQTGWQNLGDVDSGDITDYKFYGTDGKVRTGWYSTSPPEEITTGYEDDVQWFYFSNNGTPKAGPAEGTASTSDLVKINGNIYLFNEYGNPVYGLQRLTIGNTDNDTAYYFGDKSVSSVMKGKMKIDEGDGDRADYYFTETGSYVGRGYTGVKNNYLFYKGKLQKADNGSRYMLIDIPSSSGDDELTYVVNSSGRVPTSTTVKDADGNKYKVNSKGVLTEIDGTEVDGKGGGEDPVEPDWAY